MQRKIYVFGVRKQCFAAVSVSGRNEMKTEEVKIKEKEEKKE